MTFDEVYAKISGYRGEILSKFNASGGKRERWTKVDWRRMASAITALEDELELAKQGSQLVRDRLRLRDVRRVLEIMTND